MKYRILGVFLCIAVLFAAVVIQFRPSEKNERHHQHLEAEEKAACTDHGEDVFCTHLPLVHIETGGKTIPGAVSGTYDRFGEDIYTTAEDGTDTVQVKVSVYDSSGTNNHLTDVASFTTDSMIRIRGHMSRTFEKAPYLLKFVNEDGLDNDISVMGMDAHSEWMLNGPYLDKSLVRNYLFYNLSGEIMDYAPNVRFCELFLDGDYRGIYLMTESISNGDTCRLNLSVTEKGQSVTGYLYRMDRISTAELDATREIYPLSERTNHLMTDIVIRYPGKENLTEKLAGQIEQEISQFEKALFSYDFDSEDYGYQNYVDMSSAVDYFIINEFTLNEDAGRYSTYVYKQPSEKYKFCVWDFNNSCDNLPTDVSGTEGFMMQYKVYFRSFCRDREFTDVVIERYNELRQGVLSEEYINNYIDETVAFLGPAIERNTARWSEYIESDVLEPSERNAHSQSEAVDQLKAWLHDRGTWLDENINTLSQYSADSATKKYNEVSD